MASFTHDGMKVDIKPFTYGFASKTLKEKLEINLLNAFEGNNLETLISQILMNDEFALKCWWFFLDQKLQSDDPASAYDREIEKLTPELMAEFKEALWAAITSFFDPTRREILIQLRAEFKKMVTTGLQEQLKKAFEPSSTNSQPEQD